MTRKILDEKKTVSTPPCRPTTPASKTLRLPLAHGWNDPQKFVEGSQESPRLKALIARQEGRPSLKRKASARLKFAPAYQAYYVASARFKNATDPRAVDAAFVDWISNLHRVGWSVYFVTFVFNQLPGAQQARIQQMARRITKLYSALVNHTIRHTKKGKDLTRLPLMIAVPEGVWRATYNKVLVSDIRPNEGDHFHAVYLLPPWSKAKVFPFDLYFAANRGKVIDARDILWNVDIRPMDEQTARVWSYIQKSKFRNPDAQDEVLLLPEVRHPIAWWELVLKTLTANAEKTARLKAARLVRDATVEKNDPSKPHGQKAPVVRVQRKIVPRASASSRVLQGGTVDKAPMGSIVTRHARPKTENAASNWSKFMQRRAQFQRLKYGGTIKATERSSPNRLVPRHHR